MLKGGTMNSKSSLLKKLQQLSFSLTDIGLYLDGNPCESALAKGNELLEEYKSVKKEYNELYGPLYSFDAFEYDTWNWVNAPMPWEREANC